MKRSWCLLVLNSQKKNMDGASNQKHGMLPPFRGVCISSDWDHSSIEAPRMKLDAHFPESSVRVSPSLLLLVTCVQNGHECLLGNVDVADRLHAFLAFFLLCPKLFLS